MTILQIVAIAVCIVAAIGWIAFVRHFREWAAEADAPKNSPAVSTNHDDRIAQARQQRGARLSANVVHLTAYQRKRRTTCTQ